MPRLAIRRRRQRERQRVRVRIERHKNVARAARAILHDHSDVPALIVVPVVAVPANVVVRQKVRLPKQ